MVGTLNYNHIDRRVISSIIRRFISAKHELCIELTDQELECKINSKYGIILNAFLKGVSFEESGIYTDEFAIIFILMLYIRFRGSDETVREFAITDYLTVTVKDRKSGMLPGPHFPVRVNFIPKFIKCSDGSRYSCFNDEYFHSMSVDSFKSLKIILSCFIPWMTTSLKPSNHTINEDVSIFRPYPNKYNVVLHYMQWKIFVTDIWTYNKGISVNDEFDDEILSYMEV
jgi:hypothetical protein